VPFDMTGLAIALTRRERDAARRRLAKDRAEHIVGNLCAITRHAMDEGRVLSPLNCESLYRQTIRAELCLQGWPWADADRVAIDVVGVVLAILQAKRPTWNEGQPDHVIERGTLIARTRCANCGKELQGEQLRFCSNLCNSNHHHRVSWVRDATEEQLAERLSRSEL
jgi:hypothetical protein